MLVKDILETVRPAYLETWENVFAHFKRDPHEWRRVQELMEEIQKNGLHEPGRIAFHESFTGDKDFLPEEEEYFYLANGTHRFAAHYFLGLEEFPVETEKDESETSGFYQQTEVELWLTHDDCTPAELENTAYECFLSSLNFRVDENVWAELEFSSSSRLHHATSFKLSFLPIPAEAENKFVKMLLQRISCCVEQSRIEYLSVGLITHYDEGFCHE